MSLSLRSLFVAKAPKRKLNRLLRRRSLCEQLESRMMLSAVPIAVDDPWYNTAQNTALTIGTSNVTLLNNDWDPEGSALTASVVDNPDSGVLSSFSGANGTFTYTPNALFVGVDTFTYRVSDGTDNSNLATVSIAVGGHFGPRTNLEETSRNGNLLTGELELRQRLTPGISLIYDSSTLPRPIVALETFLQDSSAVPTGITAQLTFNSTAGTAYTYDTTGLAAGDDLRFALQADATALASGRYDYSVKLTADMSGTLVDSSYSGSQNVVNRGSSSHPFGRGWQLEGLDELVVDTDGVLWVQDDGDALWFAEDGSGGFESATGDIAFSTLVANVDGTFTLTNKHGVKMNFDSGGKLTSQVDRNGNTIAYTYTSGLLTKITDAVGRDTTFAYTSGQLTSITDSASRVATLTYDTGGHLTRITQPDPDGIDAQLSPETDFTYDTTSHQLTQVTDPLNYNTAYQYGTHGRLTKITFPDANTRQLSALQTFGLPATTSGNSLAAAGPRGTVTDERGKVSQFQTDRFGNTTLSIDPLSNATRFALDAVGQVAILSAADPDGTGAAASPVTVFGYDASGNKVYSKSPRGFSRTWTYTTAFNQVATSTDELGNVTSYSYDGDGNSTATVDPAGFQWTYTYDSSGRVLTATAPDPDATGPLAAPVTSYAYDSYRRLQTTTNPDSTTVTFAYDAADNRTSITDELSNVTASTYDSLNRITSTTDRESATTTFAYSVIGLLTTQTDALGNATVNEYNSRGWVTKTLQPDPDGAGPLVAGGSEYIYDGAGNLTNVGRQEMLGDAFIGYSYDDAGRRTSSTGPTEFVATSYEYDSLGRLIKTTDPTGLKTENAYDASGNVIQVQRNDEFVNELSGYGPTTLFSYDASERLTSETDPRGYKTSYGYNSRGLLQTTILPDPDGSGPQGSPYSTNTFDNIGRLVAVTDHLSRATTYEYDSRDRMTKLTEPDPDQTGSLLAPVTSYAFDAGGRMTSETDPLLRVSSFTYDDEGRVIKSTAPDPDGTGPLASPETQYTYDGLGKVLTVTDPRGGVTEFAYDGRGRIIEETSPDPDGVGAQSAPITTYVYNGQGRLGTVTDPLGRVTTFAYDNIGRKTSATDDSGNSTSYAYDDLDRIISVTEPDPDGAGALTGSVTSYAYDTYHRLKETTDPAGGKTSYTYDVTDNLLTLNDPVINLTSYAYDGLGRLTMETNDLNDTRSYYYDSVSRLTRRVDRNSQIRQFSYDGLDRTVSETWYSGGTPVPEIAIATTTDGGLTNEVQRVGFSDSWSSLSGGTFTLSFSAQTTANIAFDAPAATVQAALEGLSNVGSGDVAVIKSLDLMGQQEWTVTFGGALAGTDVSQITVDSSGVSGVMVSDIEQTDTQGGVVHDEVQTVTLTNANGGTMRLAFNGQTTAELAHDATTAQIEVAMEDLSAIDQVTVTGAAGGPWTITFAGTHIATNQPQLNGDAAALLSGTEQRAISFVYDAASQLTSASDPDSSYSYAYDNLGRVLTVDNYGTAGVPNVVLTSAYDAASNRTSLAAEIATVDDFLSSYTYDSLNRLTRLDQAGQTGGNSVAEKRIDFAYNAISQFASIARYKDTTGSSADEVATSTYSYDTLNRLSGLAYKEGGVNLFTPYGWSYDNMSRITQLVSADGTSDYSYDPATQLTAAVHTYQTNESYSYDANGNRTNTGYSTGDNNQLLSDGVYNYLYDDEGNRTKKTEIATGEATEYQWDHRNRLVEVTHLDSLGSATQTLDYKYDVFDARIEKSDTPAVGPAYTERYVYDGAHLAIKFDGSQLANRYLHGPVIDQILADEQVSSLTSPGDILWPLADNLGTVRDLASHDSGTGVTTIANHISYDAFGDITAETNAAVDHLFAYTGREWDAEADLQYNRARWYDPSVGRWLSQDPIEFEAGDANLYRYVGNKSTMANDPSGLEPPEKIFELDQASKDAFKDAMSKKSGMDLFEDIKDLAEDMFKDHTKELLPNVEDLDDILEWAEMDPWIAGGIGAAVGTGIGIAIAEGATDSIDIDLLDEEWYGWEHDLDMSGEWDWRQEVLELDFDWDWTYDHEDFKIEIGIEMDIDLYYGEDYYTPGIGIKVDISR